MRQLENSTHAINLYSSEIELAQDEDFKNTKRQDLDGEEKISKEWKTALLDAQKGKYRKLKEQLDAHVRAIGQTDPLFEDLWQLISTMPDTGPNFTPPMPAWTDPRFKGGEEV